VDIYKKYDISARGISCGMLFILITARMPSCTSWVTRSRPCTCKRTLFTSRAIAKALIDAEERGLKVVAILNASNQTRRYSARLIV